MHIIQSGISSYEAFRLPSKSALPRTGNRGVYNTVHGKKDERVQFYTHKPALPVSSSSLRHVRYCTRSNRGRVWHCTHDRLSHRHAVETEACMLLYTLRLPVQLTVSLRAIVSRHAIVSFRYQLVTHPDPLRLSVQSLPAQLVLIEGDAEIVVDVLPVDFRNYLFRR